MSRETPKDRLLHSQYAASHERIPATTASSNMDASGASIAAATAAGEVQRKREVIRLEDATKEQGSRSDVGKQTDAQTQLSLCTTRLPLLTDATDYQERIPDKLSGRWHW